MEITKADPYTIVASEFNERTENVEVSSDDSPSLEDSVKEIGVVEPPKVRETDDPNYDYEVIVGQRRVLAAQAAELDKIPVIVGDWDDREALSLSISENVEGFKERVSASDRAKALKTLWEEMGEEGYPSSSALSKELGVPEQTVNLWIEPLRPDYEDTIVEEEMKESPVVQEEPEDSASSGEKVVDQLGERAISEIRKATDSPERFDTVVERILGEDFVLSQVKELRTYLEEGQDLDTAVESVKQEEEEQPQSFTDFNNTSDGTEDEQEVQEIEDPTEVTEETGQDEIVQQIETVDTIELTVEGEIEFTVEIPEKTLERAENFASDFDYEDVEEFLLVSVIPEFLQEDGTETLIDQIERKAKKRGY